MINDNTDKNYLYNKTYNASYKVMLEPRAFLTISESWLRDREAREGSTSYGQVKLNETGI